MGKAPFARGNNAAGAAGGHHGQQEARSEHDRDDVANMAVDLVAGAGGPRAVDRGGAGTLKGRIGMMTGGMARRLEALEAQVTGATQTAEQREAAGRETVEAFWRKIADLGKRLEGMDAPTVEQLNSESVASLVARLVVPGPVAEDLVTEALRARLVWLEQRGEGGTPTAALVRGALAETEGEDPRECAHD